jgi:hypothetical protein
MIQSCWQAVGVCLDFRSASHNGHTLLGALVFEHTEIGNDRHVLHLIGEEKRIRPVLRLFAFSVGFDAGETAGPRLRTSRRGCASRSDWPGPNLRRPPIAAAPK